MAAMAVVVAVIMTLCTGIPIQHRVHRNDRMSANVLDADRLLEMNEIDDLLRDQHSDYGIDKSIVSQRGFSAATEATDNIADDDFMDESISGNDDHSEKRQSTALLLCIFLGWCGAARFYTGYIIFGSLQCSLFVFPVMMAVADHQIDQNGRKCGRCLPLTASGLMYISLVWWIADIVMLAANELPDRDDRALIPM